ncbi:MAG: hypothetical protein WCL44_06405 [bacterium]
MDKLHSHNELELSRFAEYILQTRIVPEKEPDGEEVAGLLVREARWWQGGGDTKGWRG